jgi:hypothetical protein
MWRTGCHNQNPKAYRTLKFSLDLKVISKYPKQKKRKQNFTQIDKLERDNIEGWPFSELPEKVESWNLPSSSPLGYSPSSKDE